MRISGILLLFVLVGSFKGFGQDRYNYTIDLTNVENDVLRVDLTTPKVTEKTITFYMPRIIPGNYRIADYGKFVQNFKAMDNKGRPLPVDRTSSNSWQIRKANTMAKITYEVEDTWDSSIEHDVYDMSGTSFEANKNFVLNTPGVFGYLHGKKQLPFQVSVTKPEGFYAATPLFATSSDERSDTFTLENVDHLYDSPIMYSIPDTATVRLGDTEVLIASYSPRQLVRAAAIRDLFAEMLTATRNYLGGKLPVKKYAFILYFNGEQAPLQRPGALEHNYSSFYALPEMPFEQIAPMLLDIAAHEFFHITTPLTIRSKEVMEFDFNQPVFSRHLWLYEGTTEYHSDHVQVTEGLAPPEEFLAKLAEKIKNSKSAFNDNLPFTELSLESAGKHKDQYGNVYEKGALIAACLDVYLLHLSDGHYGLRNLKHDLGVKFGKDSYFEDDKLFDIIAGLTYPEVREFFARYVEGTESIPYDKLFGYAGVHYQAMKVPSLGGVQIIPNNEGEVQVMDASQMNQMGKSMGYQTGDIIQSINGEPVRANNFQQILDTYRKSVRDGDPVEVVVKRNVDNDQKTVVLKGVALTQDVYHLKLASSPTAKQLQVRNSWFGSRENKKNNDPVPAADPADVGTIDQIVKSLYDVISGPAGQRNWNRFYSLFYEDAYMAAMVPVEGGKLGLKKFTPQQYAKSNGPLFDKFSFFEKEIGRTVNQYGTVAQVFSAYEFTIGTPQPQTERGINSLELVFENNRWWIMSISWNEETISNPIPEKFKKFQK